jgi:hypothetical protein
MPPPREAACASLGALVQQAISVLTGLRQTHDPRQDVTARQARRQSEEGASSTEHTTKQLPVYGQQLAVVVFACSCQTQLGQSPAALCIRQQTVSAPL